MRVAYIRDGVVSEIIDMSPEDFARYYPESFRRDCQECGDDVQPNWLWDGERFAPRAEPLPTLDEVIADYEARIQQRLDDFARTLTYDGIMSACTYATSGVDMYRIEGQYCVDARDATWAKAYELLSAILPTVQAGGAIPAWEAIEAELPVLEWPEGSRGYGV